jgi:ABC-type glutathione transport system ATPase component
MNSRSTHHTLWMASYMPTDSQIRSDGALPLRVCGLSKRYRNRARIWRKSSEVCAANGISFEIPGGKTLGLVGSSGSGKSTVARCITRLEKPDAGEIWMGNIDIARLGSRELRPVRAEVQMIFQDSSTSMNPRMSAAEIIEEPLLIQNRGTRNERRGRAAELMKEVGLSPDWLDRRITEFSGGQGQRIAIARALALGPKFLVLDEALSGLDLSTRSQIADLLLNLQAAHSLTYLLISHDLGLVARLAGSIAIMSAGQIVEQGPTREIISNPTQPATKVLVAAAERFRTALAQAKGASA